MLGISDIAFRPFTTVNAIELIIIIILLFCSALSSASEVALFSLNHHDLKEFQESKSKRKKMAHKLLDHQDKLLATILSANNFFNIAIIILSAHLTNSLIDFSNAQVLGFIFQVIVVTFLILFFGEILPKVFAVDNARAFSQFIAYPLLFVSKILSPIIWLLLISSKLINKNRFSQKQSISIDDLSNAIEITSDSLKEEKSILEGIVTFGSKEVSQIMRPRVDIVGASAEMPFSKILSIIVESEYSRIPVYDETLDNIKGILYSKDLLPYLHKENTYEWQSLVRSAYFVPETKKIDDLLSEFQKRKIHMAIVVDEYGGTLGLITMEDILEEIIGEISDESDAEEEKLYKIIAPNIYLFEAKVQLNDFCKITDIDDTYFDSIKGDSETLAGLFLELKGEIPRKNDSIEFKNFSFIIEAVDSRKIRQIKAIRKND